MPSPQRTLILVALAIAAFFVIAAYDRYLPVVELDEGILLSQTIRDRGIESFDIYSTSGYPPVIMSLFTISQIMTETILKESVLNHAGLVVHIVRIMAIIANLFSVFLLYQTGKKLAHPFVGIASACIWATLPLINQQASLALTEAWQIMFITASAWAMLKALESHEIKWLVLCTAFGLFAVLSKYNTFPVLGFGVGTSLWFLISQDRKHRWLALLIGQFIAIATMAYLLFNVYGAMNLIDDGREVSQFVNSGFQALLDPNTILDIFSVASIQLGFPHLLLLIPVLITGLGISWYESDVAKRIATAYMLIFVLFFVWMVPSYLLHDVLKNRYVSSASSIFVLLVALSIWYLIKFLLQRLKINGRVSLAYLCIIGLWFAPAAWTRLNEFVQLQYPHAGQEAVQWSIDSLEPGASLAITGLEGNTMRWRYFNNIWGDYDGPSRPLMDILLYLQEPKQVWEDAGIEYVHLTGNYPGDFPNLPFALDEMLLLKAFESQYPGDNSYNDNASWYIYRLNRYENTADVIFANRIHLIGFDVSQTSASAGSVISLRLFWQALQTPDANYQFFIHLSDLDAHTVLAQVDGTPGLPSRMTTTWNDSQETLVSPLYELTIPASLETGNYRLMLGLYHPETGERLLTDDGQSAIELSALTIESEP